jgi:hypothetical protein
MDGFMVQHPRQRAAALAHDLGLDAQRAGCGIPFAGGTDQPWGL